MQYNLLGFLNPEWQLNKNNYFFIPVIKHSTCLILYYCEICQYLSETISN